MVESFLLRRLPIASYAQPQPQPAAAPGFDFLSEVYGAASFAGPNAGDYGGEMGFLDIVEPKAASATLVDGATGLGACKVEPGLAKSGGTFGAGAGAAPPAALASKKKRVEGMLSKNLMVEHRRRKRLNDRLHATVRHAQDQQGPRKAMPFSSMIQEMKGKIGAISLRGVLRFRPGGHAGAGRAPAAEPDEASREGCWAQLPFELLRMVLVRVEDQEPRWPARSAIVPGPRDAPLKCFIRRDRAAQSYSLCLGVTDGLADDGKFLLAARKCRRPACTEYLISLDAKNTSAGSYIGKLRSNFLRTKFTVYDAHPPCARAAVSKGYMIGSAQVSPGVPARNYMVSHISY
ncbi:Tubby-like F-box protein 3 [Zea mays]|uniref:Tubby-like F-box protein 3 n=1 Tax=Zea mays TaxID=4577 RepID=K7WBV8_MAIZE|nr:Tubby-like F-box protein 3 [Zea mays]